MLTPCVLLKFKSRTCLFPILPGLASPEARSGSPRSASCSAERRNSTVSVRRQDQGAGTAGVLARSSVRPHCLSIVAFSPPDPAGVKTPSAKRRARRTGDSRGPAHAVPPALRPPMWNTAGQWGASSVRADSELRHGANGSPLSSAVLVYEAGSTLCFGGGGVRPQHARVCSCCTINGSHYLNFSTSSFVSL